MRLGIERRLLTYFRLVRLSRCCCVGLLRVYWAVSYMQEEVERLYSVGFGPRCMVLYVAALYYLCLSRSLGTKKGMYRRRGATFACCCARLKIFSCLLALSGWCRRFVPCGYRAVCVLCDSLRLHSKRRLYKRLYFCCGLPRARWCCRRLLSSRLSPTAANYFRWRVERLVVSLRCCMGKFRIVRFVPGSQVQVQC